MGYLGNVDNPLHEGHSRTSKRPLSISVDSDGAPILPDVTMSDPHLARDMQTMLTHYMRAHISMSYSHYHRANHNTSAIGHATGKPKQTIPWGELTQDPSSWIKEECYPHDFEWKHPSKIKINEVFRLISYWRDRTAEGEEALIWVRTSKLFDDRPATRGRRMRRGSLQEESSHEEVFTFPQSSDPSVGEEDSSTCEDDIDEPWMGIQDILDTGNEPVIISTEKDASDSSSCECIIHVTMLAFTVTPNKLCQTMIADPHHHHLQVNTLS